jgi:hypothetical protein
MTSNVSEARWYCLSAAGVALLCTSESDAREEASWQNRLYPSQAPHIATQLVPLATQPEAPTGEWVLVPREPTLAMSNAGWRDLENQGIEPEDVQAPQIYRAMIAAAPPLRPPPGRVCGSAWTESSSQYPADRWARRKCLRRCVS